MSVFRISRYTALLCSFRKQTLMGIVSLSIILAPCFGRADFAQASQVNELAVPTAERNPYAVRRSGVWPTPTAANLLWAPTPTRGLSAAVTVTSFSAPGLRVGVLVQRLPESAILRFYGPNEADGFEISGQEVLTALQRNADAGHSSDARKTFWSPYIENQSVTMWEIELPAGATPDSVEISIAAILSQFYGKALSGSATALSLSRSCEIDASCHSQWNTEGLASAMIVLVDELGEYGHRSPSRSVTVLSGTGPTPYWHNTGVGDLGSTPSAD